MKLLLGCKRFVAALAFVPVPALAQNCAGFTDVQTTEFFCSAVEWIKNRGVTLGCTTTEYCPNDNVIRAQMALFMQRLGDAMTPSLVRSNGSAAGTYSPQLFACVSEPVPITGFPRQATFAATIRNFEATAPKRVTVQLAYSTDNGTSWTNTPDAAMSQTVVVGGVNTLPVNGGPLALAVGSTYRFALRATTDTDTATVSGECQLIVRLENRS